MQVDLNRLLLLLEHLPGVMPSLPVQMEEPVAVRAEVAAGVTQDDGQGLSVIMIVAGGSLLSANLGNESWDLVLWHTFC